MTPEKHTIDHIEAQHEVELAWIEHNTPLFTGKASGYFGLVGRGAIIVDAASKPLSEGPLFTYFSKEQMKHIADNDVNEMVDDYDPSNEFIVLILLPQDEKRAHRVCASEEQRLGTTSSRNLSYART